MSICSSLFCCSSCKWAPWFPCYYYAVLKTKADASHFSHFLFWLSFLGCWYILCTFICLLMWVVPKDYVYWCSNGCFDHLWQLCLKASAGKADGEEDRKLIRKGKDGWNIDYSGEKPGTPLLDTINYPAHMKNLSTEVGTQQFCCVGVSVIFAPLCYDNCGFLLLFRISNN